MRVVLQMGSDQSQIRGVHSLARVVDEAVLVVVDAVITGREVAQVLVEPSGDLIGRAVNSAARNAQGRRANVTVAERIVSRIVHQCVAQRQDEVRTRPSAAEPVIFGLLSVPLIGTAAKLSG